jgi:hypothetical protein
LLRTSPFALDGPVLEPVVLVKITNGSLQLEQVYSYMGTRSANTQQLCIHGIDEYSVELFMFLSAFVINSNTDPHKFHHKGYAYEENKKN